MVIVWILDNYLKHGNLFFRLPLSRTSACYPRVDCWQGGGRDEGWVEAATQGARSQCTEEPVEATEQQSELAKASPERNREAGLIKRGEEACASAVTAAWKGWVSLGAVTRVGCWLVKCTECQGHLLLSLIWSFFA